MRAQRWSGVIQSALAAEAATRTHTPVADYAALARGHAPGIVCATHKSGVCSYTQRFSNTPARKGRRTARGAQPLHTFTQAHQNAQQHSHTLTNKGTGAAQGCPQAQPGSNPQTHNHRNRGVCTRPQAQQQTRALDPHTQESTRFIHEPGTHLLVKTPSPTMLVVNGGGGGG